MQRPNHELSRAIRKALGIHPAAIGGAAVVVALAAGGIAPAHAAPGISIGPGATRGALSNSVAQVEFLDIDTSTINGDISNLVPGSITGVVGSTPAIFIRGSTVNGSFINDSVIGDKLLDTTGTVMMMDTNLTGSITNNSVIRGEGFGLYLNNVTATGGVHNSGLIQSDATGIMHMNTGGIIRGGITNTGTIRVRDDVGIDVHADTFNGGINNSGLIDSDDTVISIDDVITFKGGITNSGTMRSRSDEVIDTGSTLTFMGGIHNSGLMRGGDEDAIDLDGLDRFEGGIHNSGTIIGAAGYGIYADVSTFTGGIHNSGLLDASSDAIYLDGDRFSGGIVNKGTVISRTYNWIDSNVDTFLGGINNSGLVETYETGIYISGDRFEGGIRNSGTLDARSDAGVEISLDTFLGGFHNEGLIRSEETALDIDVTRFSGGITNSGTLESRNDYGIALDASTFTGGINNSGLISGETTGLDLDVDHFSGGIVNSGTIIGRSEYAIDLDFDTFLGGINNSGLIRSVSTTLDIRGTLFDGGIINSGTLTGSTEYGIDLSASTFMGGINNSGVIESQSTTLSLDVSTFLGGIANSGTLMSYSGYGIDLDGETFKGGINNSGLIDASDTALYISVDTFFGGIKNTGTIYGFSDYGIELNGDTFAGGIDNSGLIDALSTAIYVNSGVTFDGDIVNSGTIRSQADYGIRIRTDFFTGMINNSGLIDGSDAAIYIDGIVAGGITNTGTLTAFDHAIDLGSANAAHVINQNGGAVYGGIDLDNGFLDTLNIRGGMIESELDGDGTDVINVLGNGSAWFDGFITDIDQINVNSGMLTFDGWIESTNTLSVSGGSFRLRPSALVEVTDYSQTANGTLSYELIPGGRSGQIMATGTATLNGTLEVTPMEGAFFADMEEYHSIIAAPSLTGTFSDVTSTSLFLSPTVLYGTTNLAGDPDVDLRVERVEFNDAIPTDGFTSNQRSVAAGIEAGYAEAGGTNEAADELYTMLFQMASSQQYSEFLEAISGSSYPGVQQAAVFGQQGFNGIMQSRLGTGTGSPGGVSITRLGAEPGERGGAAGDAPFDMGAPGTWSAWVSGYGGWGDVDGDSNAPGFDQDGYGVAFGIDYQLNERWLIGAAGGYGESDLDFDGGSDTEIETWNVAAYAQWDNATWFANALFAYGDNDFDSDRRIVFGAVNTTAFSDTDGETISIYGEGGYHYQMETIELRPFFGIGWVDTDTDGFTETGAGIYNLIVDDGDSTSVTSNLGVRARADWTVMENKTLTAEARAVWQHELDDTSQEVDAALDAVRTVRFRVESQDISRDTGVFGVGLNLEVSERADVYFNFDARVNSDYDSQAVGGGVRISW